MRLATWNVNGLRARLDYLRYWLAAQAPDVVGLQELKLSDEQFPHEELGRAGYRALVHGQKAWNGVAILVRDGLPAPEPLQLGLPGQEAAGARLVAARIGSLDFTTVYVPNGKSLDHEDFAGKLAWLDALGGWLARAGEGSRPAVVCGDFNLCPGALDTHDEARFAGSIFHTVEERARCARILASGWHDLFRERNPEAREYSWWDYRSGAFHRGWGLRIDLVLGTASVLARTTSAVIGREYRKKQDGLTASDHAPVMVDLAD